MSLQLLCAMLLTIWSLVLGQLQQNNNGTLTKTTKQNLKTYVWY